MYSLKITTKVTGEELFMRSKWWGNPDLPVGFPVPEDMNFICQLRCDELASIDDDGLLPHEGMLYFFGCIDYYLGNIEAYYPVDFFWNNDDIRVYYVKDIKNQDFEQVVFVDDDDNAVAFRERAIVFSRAEACCDGNKLLGEPFNREWEDWGEPCNGWIELLQVDSDEDDDFLLNFIDFGMLHVIIDPEDLRNRDFSNVTAVICST